ncbi:MAG: acetyl-CoA carboxylase biotin carboxyl carrier protein [Candidatus Omnitrophota bacterium]
MNIKEIKEMINLMNENGIVELEIEKDGMRIKLRKTGSAQDIPGGTILVEREKVGQITSKEILESAEKTSEKSIEIKAPMVGTFYRAPSPDSAPFVETGQVIEPGQVICVIEAMKLMNEIKSEVKGKVLEILVDNSEPLEFGQPMFLVEPL